MTASALAPRRARISVASRFRIRLIAAVARFDQQLAVAVAADGEPQEVEPVVDRCTIRVLSSLKARPRGASHSASRALTCSACSGSDSTPSRSSAYLTSTGAARHRLPGPGAGRAIADPGGLLQPVQRDVQEQRTDHPALGSSLLGRGEPLALLEHARFQPVRGSVPGRETSRAWRAGGRDRFGRTPRPGPRPAPTTASRSGRSAC